MTSALLASIDALWGSCRSTSSSGRSDEGKNWRGTSGIAKGEDEHADGDGQRDPPERDGEVEDGAEGGHDGPGGAIRGRRVGAFKSSVPISGANSTATSQDARRAMLTTANSENVYSPAELAARPMGMKPAMVTSVPASIAKA